MRGPPPKDPKLRQRRNRASTRSTLPTVEEAAEWTVPEIPKRESGDWHPKVLEWWDAMWRSPQAKEYTLADIHGGLYILANHYQDFWKAEGAEGRQKASVALLKCWEKFGLSPIDRRRLQWEVEKAEQAEERTNVRRQRKEVSGKDPRDILKIS